MCEKAFFGHSDFCAGIFTAGCACKYNITLGFEIMLNNESPRNLFRLLTCNRFDLGRMTGVLMDHACKFDAYMLNCEAKPLEYLLTLVDGSHWNAQKKMKYPNSKGKGGHLGYSEGYKTCTNLLMELRKLSTAKDVSKCILVSRIFQKAWG